MATFENVGIKTNIRALAFKKPLFVFGIGSVLIIHHECNSKFEKSISLPLDQAIIGIKFQDNISDSPDEFKVLIYTTRIVLYCSIILNFENGEFVSCDLIQHHKTNLTYWIIDCVLSSKWAFILNAQNEVLIYDLIEKKISFRKVGPQKCLIYSGKILQIFLNGLVVASGTVYTEILLWSLEFDLNNLNCETKNGLTDIQTLSGHDGVIFSIDYNLEHNILVTASDDRTVRIWNPNADWDLNKDCYSSWKNNTFRIAHIYYGHLARIWKVSCLFFSISLIISSGEDSNLFFWSLLPPYKMIQKISIFKNNRIWSFETFSGSIVCGGSDGSLKYLKIEDILSCDEYNLIKKEIENMMPKSVFHLKYDNSMCRLLSLGNNAAFNLITNQTNAKELQFAEKASLGEIFNDYLCPALNDDRSKLAIASKHGHVALFNISSNQDLQFICIEKLYNSKIFDLRFIKFNSFICCISGGCFQIFDVTSGGFALSSELSYVLPLSRHRWPSCAICLQNLIIVGDCSGSLFGFILDRPAPKFEFLNIHGRNGVTCLKQKPKSNFIYSSGRNGKIYEYLIITDTSDLVVDFIKLRTFINFSNLEWIGGFEFDSKHPFNLKYAYGFESRNFIVFDLYQSRIVFEEDCGGGHRCWDLVFCNTLNGDEDQTLLRFSYGKQDSLLNLSRKLPNFRTSTSFAYSSLPRKINCCTHLLQIASVEYFLLGGEDNYIHVVQYDKTGKSSALYTTLFGHISNIISIRCSNSIDQNGKHIVFVISVGGRSQLIVWKFWLSPDGQLICQERVSHILTLATQQPVNKVKKVTDLNQLTVSDNSDIRYLDVDFIPFGSNSFGLDFLILIACSDVSFRTFKYCDNSQKITPIQKVSHGNACILQAKFLPLDDEFLGKHSINSLFALSSNDGLLHLWSIGSSEMNVSDEMPGQNLLLSSRLHQSGINSLQFKQYSERICVISGGDDNTIKLSLLIIQRQDSRLIANITNSVEQHSIHTCQITGLQFISDCFFVSGSIDQKIVLWQFSMEDSVGECGDNNCQLALKPTSSYNSSIADISFLEAIKLSSDKWLLLLCGEGFEFVQF